MQTWEILNQFIKVKSRFSKCQSTRCWRSRGTELSCEGSAAPGQSTARTQELSAGNREMNFTFSKGSGCNHVLIQCLNNCLCKTNVNTFYHHPETLRCSRSGAAISCDKWETARPFLWTDSAAVALHRQLCFILYFRENGPRDWKLCLLFF